MGAGGAGRSLHRHQVQARDGLSGGVIGEERFDVQIQRLRRVRGRVHVEVDDAGGGGRGGGSRIEGEAVPRAEGQALALGGRRQGDVDRKSVGEGKRGDLGGR